MDPLFSRLKIAEFNKKKMYEQIVFVVENEKFKILVNLLNKSEFDVERYIQND